MQEKGRDRIRRGIFAVVGFALLSVALFATVGLLSTRSAERRPAETAPTRTPPAVSPRTGPSPAPRRTAMRAEPAESPSTTPTPHSRGSRHLRDLKSEPTSDAFRSPAATPRTTAPPSASVPVPGPSQPAQSPPGGLRSMEGNPGFPELRRVEPDAE
jgi:hypothetical protein